MFKTKFILLAFFTIYFSSCSNSPDNEELTSAKRFLEENMKNTYIYEQLPFTKPYTKDIKLLSLYKFTHIYSVINAEIVLDTLYG